MFKAFISQFHVIFQQSWKLMDVYTEVCLFVMLYYKQTFCKVTRLCITALQWVLYGTTLYLLCAVFTNFFNLQITLSHWAQSTFTILSQESISNKLTITSLPLPWLYLLCPRPRWEGGIINWALASVRPSVCPKEVQHCQDASPSHE